MYYRVPSARSGLGLALPSTGALLDVALAEVRPVYLQQVARARPWLEARGRAAGRAILRSASSALPGAPPPPNTAPWVVAWIDPVVDPVLKGLQAEMAPALRTVGAGAGIGVLAALIGAFALGRLTNR